MENTMQEEIKSLVESLDWRADPKPSPYQKRAWEELENFPKDEVIAALKEFKEELVRNCPSFWPYDYVRIFRPREIDEEEVNHWTNWKKRKNDD